jgi:hypothetical protein
MAIRIAEVRSSSLSQDNKEVIVGGYGKYVGDVELRFARECVDDLIAALTRTKNPLDLAGDAAAGSDASTAPKSAGNGTAESKPDEIRFEVPKNFTVTADTVLASRPPAAL